MRTAPSRARAAGLLGAVLALGLSLAGCSSGQDGRTSPPPWSAPTDVSARVKAAGLELLTAEGTALHTHQHLTITVDGSPVVVPADIGIDEAAQRISAIHTHDESGVLHVESPEVRTFTLGQAFTEWNVHLAKGQVGPYADGQDGRVVAVFVNGTRTARDPREIRLTEHEDIDVVVVRKGQTPAAPPAFRWPSNL
jgi:hypothetical protein